MEGFQDQALAAMRCGKARHRADDRTIAVAPQNSPINTKCIKKLDRLRGRSAVKIERHLSRDSRRVPVTRSIRDQDPEFILEGVNLPGKRIDSIAPSSMEKNQRTAVTELTVMDFYRTDIWCVQRLKQLNGRQLTQPPNGTPSAAVDSFPFRRWIHALYSTPQIFRTQLTTHKNTSSKTHILFVDRLDATYLNQNRVWFEIKTAGSICRQPFMPCVILKVNYLCPPP